MKRISWLLVGALLIATAIAPQTKQQAHPRIGKPAPAFTLPTVDGKKLSLSDLKGKVVLLNFFSHW